MSVHSPATACPAPGLSLAGRGYNSPRNNSVMARQYLSLCAALLLACGAGAQAADTDTAQCVAVLKLQSNDLARQVKSGNEARRPELLQVLRQGAAFVGDAWLDGMGDENSAKAKLAQAEDQVRKLEPTKATALRQQCGSEADTMISQAPGWQRKVIDRFAQARMDKLLQSPQ
jgi:hypothetical protein